MPRNGLAVEESVRQFVAATDQNLRDIKLEVERQRQEARGSALEEGFRYR